MNKERNSRISLALLLHNTVNSRYIGENNRLIQDVMYLTKRLNMPGIAIVLDFRKAFDTIKWNYLLSTL